MSTSKKKAYSRSDQELFLAKLLQSNGNLSATCKETGIFKTTISQWKANDPWFAEKYSEVISVIFDDIEADVLKQARKKRKFNVQRFLLVNHPEGKKRGYGPKATLEADLPSWVEVMRRAGEGL